MPDREPRRWANDVLGALIYMERPGDEERAARIRKLARGIVKWTAGPGFAIWFATRAVPFGMEWVRHEWAQGDALSKANVAAQLRVATKLEALTDVLQRREVADAAFQAAMLARGSRLQGPVRAPVVIRPVPATPVRSLPMRPVEVRP